MKKNVIIRTVHIICLCIAVLSTGCTSEADKMTEIKKYPIDGMDGIISQENLSFDKDISDDGNGSLRIVAKNPTVVRLYETGGINVENARLIYQAKIRTEGVEGKVWLEMLCSFSGKGEFFSRALNTAISGDTEWVSQEAPFYLKTGENPDNIKLNIVINGKGTVWIDHIRLLKAHL